MQHILWVWLSDPTAVGVRKDKMDSPERKFLRDPIKISIKKYYIINIHYRKIDLINYTVYNPPEVRLGLLTLIEVPRDRGN